MSQEFFDVLLPLPLDRSFTYSAESLKVELYDVVKVNFGRREIFGIVVRKLSQNDLSNHLILEKIKPIIEVNKLIKFNKNLFCFLEIISNYNMASKGLVLKAFLGFINSDKIKNLKLNSLNHLNDFNFNLMKLSFNQQKIKDDIIKDVNKKIFGVSLIDAVTGSGKTEIYFHIIADILKSDSSAQILILLPEIALTSQLLSRFHSSFGFSPALWHSKISKKEKRDFFYGINSGKIKVIIGARSALLLPFKNLALTIIDEEHDSSYKQEEFFNFNARDMSVLKAKIDNSHVILSSATPSIESYYNVKIKKYKHYKLNDKFFKKTNVVNIVDLKNQNLEKGSYISGILKENIIRNFVDGHQSLIFVNRRGYSNLSLCKKCGHKVACPNCSSSLNYHKNSNLFLCHYCGHSENFKNDCKNCGENNSIINIGVGVERIKEELLSIVPQARIALATSDAIKNFDDAKELVSLIEKNEIDIIIGTQLISKGYDFHNLTLVGIIDGDSGSYSSDLKSSERLFQILSQVIGRAGRKDYHGKIFLQTYNPDNSLFKQLIENNHSGFLEMELKTRELANMPPFTKMAKLTIEGFDEKNTLLVSRNIAKIIPFSSKVEFFGPAPAPLFKYLNKFNYNIFIKTDKNINIQKLIIDILQEVKIDNRAKVRVDIDPQ